MERVERPAKAEVYKVVEGKLLFLASFATYYDAKTYVSRLSEEFYRATFVFVYGDSCDVYFDGAHISNEHR